MKRTPIISFDIEDWAQSTIDTNLPITDLARRNTDYLLNLLDDLDVKATMFVLGKFAKKFPNSVRDIHARGHEIACHGFGHVNAFIQDRSSFREDVSKAKKLLEDLTGVRVNGYRAPAFSILKENIWALGILSEEGFLYDSSIYPIKHNRYGISDFSTDPTRVNLKNGNSIVEVPLSALKIVNLKLPVAGGGYHRLLPSYIINRIISQILKTRHFVFYAHPYEFNGNEFESVELKELGLKLSTYMKIHQGLGRGRVFERRFTSFVKEFRPEMTMMELVKTIE